MQISPPQSESPHNSLREVRLSPPSPEDQAPRTILYTYSGGGTIALPENLSPTNLSIVQPPRVSSSSSLGRAPPSIRWTTSTGSFISDMESSSIAYDLMTPMISGDPNPGATLQLSDGIATTNLNIKVHNIFYCRPVFQYSDGTYGCHSNWSEHIVTTSRPRPHLPL